MHRRVVCALTWIKCGSRRGDTQDSIAVLTLATVNADRGFLWSDPHQKRCHQYNNGTGKRHPLNKHYFLPLCVTVPVFRPAAS